MNLSQLYYFVVTCENDNNMTRAAKKLTISQSAISYAVRALEREFKIKLFYRDAQGLNLTDEGREFLEYASRVIEASRTLSEHFHRGRPSGSRELALGLTALAQGILRAPLAKVGSVIPVTLTNTCVFQTDVLLSLLDRGDVDLVIIGTSHLDDLGQYGSRVLGDCRTVLYTSSRNPLARQRSVRPQQLEDAPLFLFLEYAEMISEANVIFPQFIPGLRMRNVRGFSTEIASAVSAIRNHDCSVLIGHGAIEPAPDIREILIEGVEPFQIVALWSEERGLPDAARVLIDEFRAFLEETA